MNEPRGPHEPSHPDRTLEAARQAAGEVLREEAAMARDVAEDLAAAATALGAPEDLPDPVTQAIDAEIAAVGSNLSPQAKDVLANLLRLHFSLAGPQRALETGVYGRPGFPVRPPRIVGR